MRVSDAQEEAVSSTPTPWTDTLAANRDRLIRVRLDTARSSSRY